MVVMMEISMVDLTRGLTGFPHHRFDPSCLEVEIQVVDADSESDPDDEAFADAWFRVGDELSDGRIDEPFELSPSEVITLAIA
ncbi:MAG: hypothetical protein IPQ07_09860 [Myxococcales bacterium]|nr:hypothetical protein [Myxococcales bacterium]